MLHPPNPPIHLICFPTCDLVVLRALNASSGVAGGEKKEAGGEAFDRLKCTLRAKPIRIAEGISWVLPTVMSNKVCCKVPTLPLCCDTKSCQKILKSLHELGDGSCNYLSYCLAAGALPHCCRPPLWSVLRLFALFLSQLRAPSPRWASRRPSPLAPTGEDARRARLRRDTPCSFWEKFCFSWPGPKPGFASVSSTPRNLGRADGAAASTHTQAHTPNAAFCVCVCGFPAPPPSLLAPNELEQYRQLQALPVLHLLPKTSSK